MSDPAAKTGMVLAAVDFVGTYMQGLGQVSCSNSTHRESRSMTTAILAPDFSGPMLMAW